MAVCVDCKHYSKLKEDIHRLETELWDKDQLIQKCISVAFQQNQYISHLRSFTHAGPAAGSPTSLVSQVVSASAATLPWLPSTHTEAGMVPPESSAAELRPPFPADEVVAGVDTEITGYHSTPSLHIAGTARRSGRGSNKNWAFVPSFLFYAPRSPSCLGQRWCAMAEGEIQQ